MQGSHKIHKGLVITLIVVGIVVLFLTTMLSFVFVVKDVKANLLKEGSTLTNEQINEDIEKVKLKVKGNSVFFYNRSSAIADIESKLPKIKVVNLEIKFPNVMRINCEERIPLFALSLYNSVYDYAIVDDDFKVLDNTNNSNCIPLKFNIGENGEEVLFKDFKLGEFVNNKEITAFTNFLNSLQENDMLEERMKHHFNGMELYYRESIDGQKLCLHFLCKNNDYEIFVYDIETINDNKINILLSILSNDNISQTQIIE